MVRPVDFGAAGEHPYHETEMLFYLLVASNGEDGEKYIAAMKTERRCLGSLRKN